MRTNLAAARATIRKKYGTDSYISFEEDFKQQNVEVVPTGCILVDAALGVGGFATGRIHELYGPQSCGKSTLAHRAAAQAQKLGKVVAEFDFEHSFDPAYAKLLGLDLSDKAFFFAQPESLERGMQMFESLLEADAVGFAIFDSLAAMITVSELEGEIGDAKVASQARAMAQVLKRLTAKIHNSNCATVFINQERQAFNQMSWGPPKKTTPGGDALKFYASTRIELRPMASIKGKISDPATGKMMDGTVGLQIRAVIMKNKLATPFRQGYFHLIGGKGISEISTIVDVAIARGIISQAGSRYRLPWPKEPGSTERINLGGKAAVEAFFEENPGKLEVLRNKILQYIIPTTKEDVPIIPLIDAAKASEPDEAMEAEESEDTEDSDDEEAEDQEEAETAEEGGSGEELSLPGDEQMRNANGHSAPLDGAVN
jgi:recombination protein RecA